MAKILITGANGFIGNHLVRVLKERHEIFGLVRKLSNESELIDVNWIEQDLTEPLEYSRLPKYVDAIIHLAQSKQYRNFPDGAKDVFDINVYSTFELLEYARKTGIQYFLFASSGGIYGYSYEKFVETDPVSPLNFYLSSKHTAELLIANYRQFFCTVVFRFFFVYGPGQKGMLIPTLLNKVINGETIIIEGDPGLRINPIYIEDVIRVFEPALQLQNSELFNVAGDENVTITDLVRLIEQVSGKKATVGDANKDSQGDLIGDNTRMKEILRVYPKISLFEGLKKMIKESHYLHGTK
jgi:nucleoside-diphosphate-sugar epimerase